MANTPLVIRLDDDFRQRLGLFQDESHLSSVSAAARMLMQLGLEKGSKLDPVWRALVVDETVRMYRGRVLSVINTALASIDA